MYLAFQRAVIAVMLKEVKECENITDTSVCWSCRWITLFLNSITHNSFFSSVTVKFNVNDSIDDSSLDMHDVEQPEAEQMQDPKVCTFFM